MSGMWVQSADVARCGSGMSGMWPRIEHIPLLTAPAPVQHSTVRSVRIHHDQRSETVSFCRHMWKDPLSLSLNPFC